MYTFHMTVFSTWIIIECEFILKNSEWFSMELDIEWYKIIIESDFGDTDFRCSFS